MFYHTLGLRNGSSACDCGIFNWHLCSDAGEHGDWDLYAGSPSSFNWIESERKLEVSLFQI